jgi:prepilin peptidase CpaA
VIEFTHPQIASAELWIAGVVGVAASIEDVVRRTISNWFALAALAGGVVCHCLAQGWRGLPAALAGTAAGFGVFLIFYLLGGMGGGDVKLMAGFGALLGAGRLVEAAFWTALIGGLLALAVFAAHTIRNRKKTAAAPEAATAPGSPARASGGSASPLFIPYAPAIVCGVWLTLLSSR